MKRSQASTADPSRRSFLKRAGAALGAIHAVPALFEDVHAGNAPGEEFRWDAEAMRFPNHEAANIHVAPAPREGWVI